MISVKAIVYAACEPGPVPKRYYADAAEDMRRAVGLTLWDRGEAL